MRESDLREADLRKDIGGKIALMIEHLGFAFDVIAQRPSGTEYVPDDYDAGAVIRSVVLTLDSVASNIDTLCDLVSD